ncbi:helicase-associated domain-containing protein [Microbacterium sp. NC79]|uniref:helicase-associated domain-containing protein n=1 Tax=Microbacterium sp. NC79 TaxID=2851009 RepID=UPI001C2C512C|nr:helicase-associated domain-containing protein [Microbacterium sp. NC79]MBV0895446.1 helicase-associated domain-containing protein [Microbacterium sp. NC79]
MTTDARGLAVALATQSDEALERLFTARDVSPRVVWRDFFDTAEAFLEPASIQAGLRAVTAAQAAALRQLAAGEALPSVDQALVAAGFMTADGTMYAPVASVVRQLPTASNTPADDSSAEPAARAAERAFTTIGNIADLLTVLLTSPLAQIGSGAVSAAERRRLAEANVVDDPDDVDTLLRIGLISGLTATLERTWMATPTGANWLRESNRERWDRIARAIVAYLPAGMRADDGSVVPAHLWPGAYPWDPEWPARASRIRTALFLLGLLTADGTATPWAAPLLAGGEPDRAALSELLPHEVDQIYLQHDLTAISPGPLEAALDIRLRSMAVRESHAQASTYRFTPSSLMDAVTGGETEETITEFLTKISLTGIPQPLAYLVGETARRHGSIRVGKHGDETLVTAETNALIDTLAVDQVLRPLGLTRSSLGLVSRVGRDTVAVALADAHYPVILVAADGTPERLQRHRLAEHSAAHEAHAYADLIERLRESARDNSETAWLERELELAVRNRSTVTVTVAIPGADQRTFTLEASGFGGGRLRGRDKAADVERTLPISHITQIETISSVT